jgi:hypothetical protein
LKELKHLEHIIATLGVKHIKQCSNKNICNNIEQLLQHEIESTETFRKYLLQHLCQAYETKTQKTNATKQYCLLQQQNDVTATIETKSSMRDATSGKKKTKATKKNYLLQ